METTKMNKLINDLAVQAGLVDKGNNQTAYMNFDHEKFAELIITEALAGFKKRISTRYKGSDEDCNIGYGMEIVCDEIANKFGIK